MKGLATAIHGSCDAAFEVVSDGFAHGAGDLTEQMVAH